MDFSNFFKMFDIKYENQNVKLIVLKNIPEMEVAGEEIGSVEESSYIEVKNWIADELMKTGMAKLASDEERLSVIEIQKAQVKETMQSPRRFSTLPEDFYPKLRKFLKELKSKAHSDPVKMQELQKVHKLVTDIVSSRLGKILILSSAQEKDENLLRNLTPEERILYDTLNKTVNAWRELALKC